MTSNAQIPFEESKTASNIAHDYLRSLHRILDFSSLNSESFIYTLLSKQRPINTKILTCLSACRKNHPLYYKEELGCIPLARFDALSPKQYSVLPHNNGLTIPSIALDTNSSYREHNVCSEECSRNLMPADPRSLIRVKGIKRSIQQKLITTFDFQKSAERLCEPRTVKQHSLIKRDRRIFLVAQSRRAFSRFCNKAYFNPLYSNKSHYFSFPLYLKPILES